LLYLFRYRKRAGGGRLAMRNDDRSQFDPSVLSLREKEVLAFAIEGLTDQQIGQCLNISPRTVVSYWVRMRGKLGAFSRTEFVALALKHEAAARLNALQQRTDVLSMSRDRELHQDADILGAELNRAILDGLMEPVLACNEAGVLVYVNRAAERLFGYGHGELTGLPLTVLVPPANRNNHSAQFAIFMQAPEPRLIGTDVVIFGRTKTGADIRLLLLVNAVDTTDGRIATCVIRSFIDEIDFLRRRASAVVMQMT
jgi:PAS domain S-box-containing protein